MADLRECRRPVQPRNGGGYPFLGRDFMTLRILFVEKDLTTADLLVPSLERKGYQVSVSSTQRQVLSRLRSFRPDLLVVDVASYGYKGYKLCETIGTHLEGVPCIMMVDSGPASPQQGAGGHAGGIAAAYIAPPFTSRKLLYRIRQVADNLARRELHAGPLMLDLRTRTLRNGDQVHHLRPKEVELLALFMRSPGKVISRKDLMRDIWQTEYMGDTRTLSVHIRWLRLKIEPNPDTPALLRTVRGVGYRFDVPPPVR
jgi:two-component system alkaline phosphatase synthesis response regulator PhoP